MENFSNTAAECENINASTLISTQSRATLPWSLYVSHFISMWNSRGFEFGAILFIAEIYPGTLMPMSVYAVVRAAANIALAHYVGRYIDTGERKQVIRTSILGQRMAVALSCLGFLILLSPTLKQTNIAGYAVFAILVLLSCVEKLCSMMNLVSVERDWLVVIANTDVDALQIMNSHMRRIDLFCKLMSPLIIALLDGWSTKVAILVTLLVNIGMMGPEYCLIAGIFRKVPALNTRNSDDEAPSSPNSTSMQHRATGTTQRGLWHSLQDYRSSKAFLPSMALSMLYLTVLSFSGQMTTFLLAIPDPKITSTAIGAMRTISTMFELSSTFIAPPLMKHLGPVRAGIWCLSWQLLCLTPAVGLLWTSEAVGPKTSIVGFVSAVIASRAGLWSFDLIAQFLIQSDIEPDRRGSFSSTESALQNFSELVAFATTIVFARPSQFVYPALISLIGVYVAAASYAKFVRDRRGHLVHFSSCLGSTETKYRPVSETGLR